MLKNDRSARICGTNVSYLIWRHPQLLLLRLQLLKNQRRFTEDVVTEFRQTMLSDSDYSYLLRAIDIMLNASGRLTNKYGDVVKALQLAVEIKKFCQGRATQAINVQSMGQFGEISNQFSEIINRVLRRIPLN